MNHKNNPNFDFYSFGEPPQAEPNTPNIQEESWRADIHENFAPMLDTAALHRATTLSYSRVGFALALAIVLWFALSAVVVAIGVRISPALGDHLMFTSLAGTLPLYIICTPLLYLMVSGLPTACPTPKKLTLSHVVTLFLMAQGLMWAGNFIGEGLMGIMGRLTGVDYYNQLNDTVGLPIWFIAILTGILAPVFEELIFRKLMLDRMLPCGEGQAILINGLLFGLFHSNLYQFFYIFRAFHT
jgi:membrane protease YdiL (CAAX protease family)